MGSLSQGPQELGAFSCGDMRAMRSHSLGDEAALLGPVLSQQAAPEIWKEQPHSLFYGPFRVLMGPVSRCLLYMYNKPLFIGNGFCGASLPKTKPA